ncbi:sigma 54-interacting transcriptional regulator [Uliginosibacterium sp. 31-16]|uniref:sigma 54-interacting transcriptional regulator n=1 Tax=Uliginosibacterium sp. 31-16 TaxID=3068315 RepID=UPI00273D5F56|nr:sigma 54-interacting transcriptional regulator [Uliginosibacterium sp. 31-16]MDP5239633.1 sigma 54-interacting transcriptional regulator [Uliginosibacterium sp. 31-16]
MTAITPDSAAPVINTRVLLVDDDPDLLRLLSIRLKASGFDTRCADSGPGALAALASQRPDIIVTDLRMPGMDGLALFDAVRQQHLSLPVIVLTAHGNIPEAIEATQRGVSGYLTKPYDAAELIAQIRRAIGNSGGVSTVRVPAAWRHEILTRSALMEDFLRQAELVAASEVSVFISGPSGAGKELLARAIHKASPRADKPFVAINCGAIPEQLLESELFGHVKGAFTGAHRDHDGLFQSARGGTLFLDEIGDMPTPLQVKLLRVLEEREVRPVGATRSIPIDVRIISATHRDLNAARSEGRFRDDLYYRLNVVGLAIPSLAERREDIPLLAQHFLQRLAERYKRPVTTYSPEAMELLLAAPWPGNVRQLLNVVEQTVALTTTPVIPAALVQRALQDDGGAIESFEEARHRFERDYLVRLLRLTGGNAAQAARLAQRNRTEFYRLLARYHLEPAAFKESSND